MTAMTPERWQQVKAVFQQALEHDADARAAWLAQACAGDTALRGEVEKLLDGYAQAESFIETPAAELAAEVVAGVPLSGQQIAHYHVLSWLGAGGMGEVYLAQDTRLGRKVALKLLPAHFTSDAERVRRFEQEGHAASALNHPNIITIYDIGQADGVYFIATELIEGQTLRRRLATGPMPLGEAIEVAQQAASALAAAHAAGIIHRDIKPENIMLRTDGYVKVLDFGLAKLTEHGGAAVDSEAATLRQDSSTATGTVLGTLRYMSPEQARGQRVDARTDIFSLGVVLYEMLTGQSPFAGATTADVIAAILEREPPPLARHLPEVPLELERIVSRVLRKDREERYQASKDLLRELQDLKEELSFAARLKGAEFVVPPSGGSGRELPPEGGTTNERVAAPTDAEAIPGGSKRYKLAMLSALLLMIAALVAVWFWRGAPAGPQSEIKSLAVLPFKSLNREASNGDLGLGLADTVITKISQIGALTVRPTSAVRKYANQEADSLEAAQQLKVDSVLDGTWQRAGDRLRVSVNLLRVRDGTSLWADSFEMRFTDIFAIQDEVSKEVAARLRLKLSPTEQARLTKRDTFSPEAHDYYLKGMYSHEKWSGASSRADVEAAMAMFKKAIELDSKYALARAQLAYCYTIMALFFEPRQVWLGRAEQEMSQAQMLDPDLAELHEIRSEILWSPAEGYQVEEAIRELRRAAQLNPSVGHASLGIIFAHLGLEEPGMRELRRALEIDPTSQRNQNRLAEAYIWLGKYAEAIAGYDQLIAVDPNNPGLYTFSALPCLYQNQLDESQRRIERSLALKPTDPIALSIWALLAALKGGFQEAEAKIPAITSGQNFRSYHHVAYNIASIYALQAKTPQAIEWLRKTSATGLPNYPLFARDPHLDRIRQAPTFIQFMAELKPRWEGYRREFE